ncbi:MAG TPA: laccase domain-containing protein, partial [Firmicutes bacterium]|nr:laccase domain-containing protein [Bacillota bacterium]
MNSSVCSGTGRGSKMVQVAPHQVPYYVFEELQVLGFIAHGVTTRKGGVSRAPYDTLNLGYHVGDDPEAVGENRRRARACMGLDSYPVVSGEQVHGTRVAVVTMQDAGKEW